MLTDFHGRILISPRTSHGLSRTFMDEFSFTDGHLTNIRRLSRTIFIFPRTPHGLSRPNLNSLTDTSPTITDFNGQIVIFARTPHKRSETFADEF